jgi:hypothetical protein
LEPVRGAPLRRRRSPEAIEELVQLNEGHAYTYDHAALIAMIDEALAKARRSEQPCSRRASARR